MTRHGQTKAATAVCSTVGDPIKHEKFKKLSKDQRIQKLQDVYDNFGVRSPEFFVQVKPFIMWTIYRHLRGMPATYLEDLVNTAYEELVIAFEGGHTTHYNQPVYKEPLYQNEEYLTKYKNIGNFVMAVSGSAVSKYRSKNFRKMVSHEDTSEDISERIGYTDFELKNNLDYSIEEPEYTKYFNHFKFNDEFIRHLQIIKQTKPKNNILYHFLVWKDMGVSN